MGEGAPMLGEARLLDHEDGGLIGWPLRDAGPLRLILVLFFLVEGGASIMFSIEHRRQFSTRWALLFATGTGACSRHCARRSIA